MRIFISAVVLSSCSILFQELALAGTQCLGSVKLAYVNVGFIDGSIADADNGNGVYVGYYENSGEITEININGMVNINDGAKGFAIWQSLNTALAVGLKVSAWDHDLTPGGAGTCDDFDEVRIHY